MVPEGVILAAAYLDVPLHPHLIAFRGKAVFRQDSKQSFSMVGGGGRG